MSQMEARELRIGNLIRGNGDPNKFVAKVGVPEIQFAHLFDPIPLTPEWLQRFGFEKTGEWYVMSLHPEEMNISLVHEKSTYGYYGQHEEYDIKHPKHVHQLQNLYFALCGYELTLNNAQELEKHN